MNECDQEIFAKGKPVCIADAGSEHMEPWVQSIAEMAKARVDWHYSGGIAQVLHLGDAESRARVEKAIDRLEDALVGRIMRRYPDGSGGLFRCGVSEVPKGAIAGFAGLDGEQVFVVEQVDL
jgi:hypothetical protein